MPSRAVASPFGSIAGPIPSTALVAQAVRFNVMASNLTMIGQAGQAGDIVVDYGDGSDTERYAVRAGQTMFVQSLSHAFRRRGTFMPTLAYQSAGANTRLGMTSINVVSAAGATFSLLPATAPAGTPVSIGVTTQIAGQNYTLVFGDGQSTPFVSTGMLQTFSHVYAAPGPVTLSIRTQNAGAGIATEAVQAVARQTLTIVRPAAFIPSPSPSAVVASAVPSAAASATPSAPSTVAPTLAPSAAPTLTPTTTPTLAPTAAPTLIPTTPLPTVPPTPLPTLPPTPSPSPTPLQTPTPAPGMPSVSGTVSISPGTQLVGKPVTATVTTTFANEPAVPVFTVDFGDGTVQTVQPASVRTRTAAGFSARAPLADGNGSATLQHTYAALASKNYTVTVLANGTPIASAPVQIVLPAVTISGPASALAGSPATFTIGVAPLGGLPGPQLSVDFGDGTQPVSIPYAATTLTHTFAAPALETVRVSGAAGGIATVTTSVTVVSQSQSLTVQNPVVQLPNRALFVVSVMPATGFPAAPLTLNFGDGTSSSLTQSGIYPHAYRPGKYTATLVNPANGRTAGSVGVTVVGISPLVPIGQIFGTLFTVSPVLAGGETDLIVQYRLAVPTQSTIRDPILAYVDLLDPTGRLIRRTDPLEILPTLDAGDGVKSLTIPFYTPVDGRGSYLVQVVLTSRTGGEIATGPTSTLIIIGGPDPSPKFTTAFHMNGALELGPHAGDPGYNFSPGLTNALIFPNSTLGISGVFDPLSRRSDPILTLVPGGYGPPPPPAAGTNVTPNQPPPGSAGQNPPGTPLPSPLAGATAVPSAGASTAGGSPSPAPQASGTPLPHAGVTLAPGSVTAPSAPAKTSDLTTAVPLVAESSARAMIVTAASLTETAQPENARPASANAGTGPSSAWSAQRSANASVSEHDIPAIVAAAPVAATAVPAPNAAATPAGAAPGAGDAPPPAGGAPAPPGPMSGPGTPGPPGPPAASPAAAPSFQPGFNPGPSSGAINPGAILGTPLPGPAATTHPYSYTLGRATAALPLLIGGGTTLHGLDVNDTNAGLTEHVAYGYSILGNGFTSPQRTQVAEFIRNLGDPNSTSPGTVRFTYLGSQDDANAYPPPVVLATTAPGLLGTAPVTTVTPAPLTTFSQTGPVSTNAEEFEFASAQNRPLRLSLDSALSDSRSLVNPLDHTSDASEKADINYQAARYNVALDYHNAGPNFAAGGGPGSASDRVGFLASSQVTLSSIAQLALGWSKDDTRSTFSRQSDAFANFSFTLPASTSLQLGFKRDGQRAQGADTDNDQANVGLGGRLGIGTYNVAGSISDVHDNLVPNDSAITRTLSTQYALQTNNHALGIGFNATEMSGTSPNASTSESLTYGFPFLGHRVDGVELHGFDLQLTGSNTNAKSPFSDTDLVDLSAILAYHLTKHLAIGVRPEFSRSDMPKRGSIDASALRLRLDLTQ